MNGNKLCRFHTILLILLLLVVFQDALSQPTDDFWKTSTPKAQGLNGKLLAQLSDRIQAGTYGRIDSLLIVRHGYLVFERYYRGNTKEMTHPVYSVTKSVSSALVGAAIYQRKIPSVQQRLLLFFPEYRNIANLDSRKEAITLHHVLTMTAGFEWDELGIPYDDPRNPIHQLTSSRDWTKFMLDRAMSDAPGARFVYNSGGSMLLSGILRNTTRLDVNLFAQQYLFGPLGISRYNWERGPLSLVNTAWGLHLMPRDMLKFGYLFLKDGKWEDSRVLPERWIQKSVTNHVTLTAPYSYGYQWWLMPSEPFPGHVSKPNDIYIAWGYGGQFVFVIPHLDMVVVSTAANYVGNDDLMTIDFLRNYILKAVKQ